ncbi:MAG: Vitamin epoxide reductase [Candidatus Saccharibacteria bacterium]|nr:Vitamin epoxide reductase [Candidatus Saccharibacteria bacterium]
MKKLTLDKVLPWLLIVCGTIGLAMAAIITIDKINLLQHPETQFVCDLNPIISCGSVMQSAQSHVFGFPNPLIGLAAWPVVITTGVFLLQRGRLKRWYWLGLEAGTIFAVLFCHWLFFQTVYRIHAICLMCVATWIVSIITFWYVTLYNIDKGHIQLPRQLIGLGIWVRKHHLDLLLLWFLLLAFFIFKHFWYYFGRNL